MPEDIAPDATLSAEAVAYRESFSLKYGPTDFDKMAEVRHAAKDGYAAAAARAVERHRLVLDTIVIADIECTRVRSESSGPASGLMLYVFGGAFMVGDPISDLPVIGALAERCSFEVIAPHYRLAPEHPAPAASDDCLAVWRALAAEVSSRVVIAGESAGGNLALLTAQRAVREGLRLPDAMALLSPAVDLRTDPALFGANLHIDPSIDPERMAEVERVYVAAADPTDALISPLFGSMESLPPTIITTGTRDLFMSMCVRLARKMRHSGVEVECNVWDGLWHVFEFYDDFPESAESLAEIAAFLNKHSSQTRVKKH